MWGRAARDAGGAVCEANRGDAIANRPAPASGRSGINLDGFIVYKEQQGNLTLIEKAPDWLAKALLVARKAKRNAEYYDILGKSGHFQSDDYKKWAKTHRSV